MRMRGLVTTFCLLALPACCAASLIGAPNVAPTPVDERGALLEDWGAVSVRLAVGGNEAVSSEPTAGVAPFPTLRTTSEAAAVRLTSECFRAPMWPSGVDVLALTVASHAAQPTEAELRLDVPETVGWGETEGLAGGRVVVRLPEGLEPVRVAREWGCATPAQKMPGWARPASACDPAFRNIRAGMGGVPIIYRLKVAPGSEHQVFLGVCESHWSSPGQRPVEFYVEGASREVLDPVAEFGQHGAGALYFAGRDKNGDGLLQIVAAPVAGAPDRNPILNVIWVFSSDDYVTAEEVVSGDQNAAAEHYIDVGGEGDQELYEGGPLRFPVTLVPGESREFVFLLAAGGGSLPSAEAGPLSLPVLRDAAADVWEGWMLGVSDPVRATPELASALTLLAMTQAQQDGFQVALTESAGLFCLETHSTAALALDLAGQHAEAERLLRVLWDQPVPPAILNLTGFAAKPWTSPERPLEARATALLALTRHALLAGDADWTEAAWPAMAQGAESLVPSVAESGGVSERSRAALEAFLEVAEATGHPASEAAGVLKESPADAATNPPANACYAAASDIIAACGG